MIEVMPRKLHLHVCVERDRHGKLRFYFRRGKGKRIPLPPPNDPGHDEAYQMALSGSPKPVRRVSANSGTLAWLVEKYRQSGKFDRLRPSTKRMREQVLARAVSTAGNERFQDITARHIREAMDRRSPAAANNFRKIMNQLFKWAVSMEMLAKNPCEGIEAIHLESDGHHTWTVDEVAQYCERWPIGTRERLAMDLLLFTGLRRSDLFRVGRQHVSENTISIKTQKTGKWVYIPVFPSLSTSIDATKTGDLVFLCTAHGTPFASAASFGNWFRKACIEAGVPGRAHGLRKAGATIAANLGATTHELMAMYGWNRAAMAERYTMEADRRRLTVGAAERIANAFTPNPKSGSGLSAINETKSTG